MRPTFLGFRSPKERTPDPVYPKVTYDGRKLNYNGLKGLNSFSREKRFKRYDVLARNTNTEIGPGSYSPLNRNNKIPGGCVYKELVGKKMIEGDYFYVENNLVLDRKIGRKMNNSFLGSREGELSRKGSFCVKHRISRSVRNNDSKRRIFGKSSGRNFKTGFDLRKLNKYKYQDCLYLL